MHIFYTAVDNGDGSIGVEFFDSPACIRILEEHDCEAYRGEGGGDFQVNGIVSGLHIKTMEDVRDHLRNYTGMDEAQIREAEGLEDYEGCPQLTNADGSISEYGAQFYR